MATPQFIQCKDGKYVEVTDDVSGWRHKTGPGERLKLHSKAKVVSHRGHSEWWHELQQQKKVGQKMATGDAATEEVVTCARLASDFHDFHSQVFE